MPNACCLLLCLLLPLTGSRAQGSNVFPDARRESLREEVVFERPELPEPEAPVEPAASFDLAAYRTPLIIGLSGILLAALAFLLYRIFLDLRVNSRSKPVPVAEEIDVSELIEEELVESGVSEAVLERAESAGQYAIAVRLLYLGLLHALTTAGLIRYRRDYSNRDYLRQLEGQDLREDFGAVTRLYEQYWYGSHRIDRLGYRVVRQTVSGLQSRIAKPAPQVPADD